MNYTPFYDLAKDAIRYMNPENDWRFIHADSYSFYNLLPNAKYSSSFPLWEELHSSIFAEIRQNINIPNAVINNITLVKASKHTICHPIRPHCGIIGLEGEAYCAIRNGDPEDTKLLAHRAMHMHSPNLMRWGDYNSFGFSVAMGEKPIFPGNRICNLYPEDKCVFFYYSINDPKTKKGAIPIEPAQRGTG